MSHTITIEGKDVEICDKDFEALKASLLKESKVWVPEQNEKYYRPSYGESNYYEDTWAHYKGEETLLAAGLIFKQESEIQAFIAYQTALTTIKNYIVEHNLEFLPDWGKSMQSKYYIMYSHSGSRFEIADCATFQEMQQFYFKYKGDAQQVTDNCSNELKIIFRIK